MKNKPFIIKVLGKSYTVEFLADGMAMHDNLGVTFLMKQMIQINDEMALEQTEDTILHEVLHIIDKELKLGLGEETIARLAVGLHSAGYRR